MIEIFKDIPGVPGYQVSNMGRVKNPAGLQKLHDDGNGYARFHTPAGPIRVHRAMAMAFFPGRWEGYHVNHIDGNKQNNTLENLEWVTQGENNRHAYRTGLNPGRGRFTPSEIQEIQSMAKEKTIREIAAIFQASTATIHSVIHNKQKYHTNENHN